MYIFLQHYLLILIETAKNNNNFLSFFFQENRIRIFMWIVSEVSKNFNYNSALFAS